MVRTFLHIIAYAGYGRLHAYNVISPISEFILIRDPFHFLVVIILWTLI